MRLWIGGPTRDTVPARFAIHLAELYATTCRLGLWSEVKLGFDETTYVHVGRNDVLKAALLRQADHLLWLDTDMTFPPDTAARLVRHDKPIVAANCLMRDPRRIWTARRGGEQVPTLPTSTGLERIDTVGMAVMLMRTDVIARMPPPWFSHAWNTLKQTDIGEDIMFCRRVGDDHPIYIDHDISKEVGHIGQYTYRPDDAPVTV